MSFIPGDDAEALRAVVRHFLEKRTSVDEVLRLSGTETGYDQKVWVEAAEGLGLHGLSIAEEFGGSGASPVELGVVFEEMGAALYGGPFFATVGLGATLLTQLNWAAAGAFLPGIVEGKTVTTVAWAAGDHASGTGVAARQDADSWTLSGVALNVVEGSTADPVLVSAQSPTGPGVFAVTGDHGLTRTARTALDSTRRLADLRFDDAPATRLDGGQDTAGALQRTANQAALYLAAEQLGGASRTLANAVEYAGTRVQFGRAIGSFQAVKHRCANMLVDVESARSVVHHGLWTAVHDPENLSAAASLARAVASDVFQRVAAANIQVHGGIGFTWEHSAHLYLKRAKSSQLLLGSPAVHRRRLAQLLGLTKPTDGTQAAEVAAETDDASSNRQLAATVGRFLETHPVPDPADAAADRTFRQARFDEGLAVIGLPHGRGGRALSQAQQGELEQLFIRAGTVDHMSRNVIGLGMALPTLAAHGTDAQQERYLRPCFTGEEIWCQLFSEPGAGSDLAALATRAVRDGDDFIVNGQKIWTSLGHVASFAILLARTDPNVPKHKGLTYFVLDMSSPGVEVRPLRQLTGEAEFNEVYLTDVRVPAANVVGEVGNGWKVAMTTLANERAHIGSSRSERGEGPIGQAVALYRAGIASGSIDPADTAVLERLMLLWSRAEAARLTNLRAAEQRGDTPGPEGSIAKLQMAELNTAIYEFCVDISGSDALLIDSYEETAPTETSVHGGGDVRKAYLRSLANSIEGGTSEVMRNILGERVLGLPGEPRVDREIAWKDTRRS